MRFRIIDRRITDFLDYERIYRGAEKNKTYKLEKDGNTYRVKLAQMSPDEYIDRCAKLFGMTRERLIESRDDDSLKKLRLNINSGNYGIIYIDTYNKMQDGLHRAIILAERGVQKIYVLVIDKNLPIRDSSGLIKGLIFDSNDNVATERFTSFYGDGIVKLDNNAYMKFWHNGTTHQSVEMELRNNYEIKNVDAFATSEVNGKLDTYDFERLKHSAYKNILITKAKKYFRIH